MKLNQPYVKQYDQNGKLLNPISSYEDKQYKSILPNRSQRRSIKNQPRFIGNNKSCPTIVSGTSRYRKMKQFIYGYFYIKQENSDEKELTFVDKTIEHYVPCFKTKRKEDNN